MKNCRGQLITKPIHSNFENKHCHYTHEAVNDKRTVMVQLTKELY